jgi:hypothetical protein
MTGFDLLFIAGVLLTVVVLLGAAVLALAGHGRRAGRWLGRVGVIWAVYLAVAFVTAALSQPRTFAAGEPQCFDDMCFAVTGAAWQGDRLAVRVHISNNARRVTEGEGGLRGAQLWANGRLYEASAAAPPLSVRLPPGTSVDSLQLFPAPPATSGDLSGLALVLNHGTPAWFIIGESTLFHGPVLMRLPTLSAAASRLPAVGPRPAGAAQSTATGPHTAAGAPSATITAPTRRPRAPSRE